MKSKLRRKSKTRNQTDLKKLQVAAATNSHVESVNLSEYLEVVSYGVASYNIQGIISLVVLWLQHIAGAQAYLLYPFIYN